MIDCDEQRARFERQHEPAIRELLVLTSEVPTTAAHQPGDPLWTGVQLFQATLDVATGSIDETAGRITWLLPEGMTVQGVGLLPATVHRIHARLALPPDPADDPLAAYRTSAPEWGLVEVLPTGEPDPRFVDVVAKLTRVETLATPHGTFTLDRGLGLFEATLVLAGNPVRVSLATQARQVTSASLATLDGFAAAAARVTAAARDLAARELAPLASSWTAEDGLPPVSEADFAGRITPRALAVEPDGSAALYFDDRGLFLGHEVQVRLDASGRPIAAEMV